MTEETPPLTLTLAVASVVPLRATVVEPVGLGTSFSAGASGAMSSWTTTTTVSRPLPGRVTCSSLRALVLSVTSAENVPSVALLWAVTSAAPPVIWTSTSGVAVPVSVMVASRVGDGTGSTRIGSSSVLSWVIVRVAASLALLAMSVATTLSALSASVVSITSMAKAPASSAAPLAAAAPPLTAMSTPGSAVPVSVTMLAPVGEGCGSRFGASGAMSSWVMIAVAATLVEPPETAKTSRVLRWFGRRPTSTEKAPSLPAVAMPSVAPPTALMPTPGSAVPVRVMVAWFV